VNAEKGPSTFDLTELTERKRVSYKEDSVKLGMTFIYTDEENRYKVISDATRHVEKFYASKSQSYADNIIKKR
jgi:hypothetical protein